MMLFNRLCTGGSYSTINNSRGFVHSHCSCSTVGVEFTFSCTRRPDTMEYPETSKTLGRLPRSYSRWNNDGEPVNQLVAGL